MGRPTAKSSSLLIALLASLPALAQSRECLVVDTDGDGVIDPQPGCPLALWEPPAPLDAGVPSEASAQQLPSEEPNRPASTPSATAREPRWTVDFETVVGQISSKSPWGNTTVVASSSLATLRFRPAEQFSIGTVIPFGVGYGICHTSCWDWSPGDGLYAHLGAVSLFAGWDARPGPATRLPVGVLVALPTAIGASTAYPDASSDFEVLRWQAAEHALLAERTRGFEDREVFHPGVAFVPSIAALHDFGLLELSASAKVPLLVSSPVNVRYPAFAADFVGTARVMVKPVNRPRAAVSGGVRAVVMVSNWQLGGPGWSVALEPRVEARLGMLALRVGFTLPLAYSQGWVQWLPTAWGVRLGVGYSF